MPDNGVALPMVLADTSKKMVKLGDVSHVVKVKDVPPAPTRTKSYAYTNQHRGVRLYRFQEALKRLDDARTGSFAPLQQRSISAVIRGGSEPLVNRRVRKNMTTQRSLVSVISALSSSQPSAAYGSVIQVRARDALYQRMIGKSGVIDTLAGCLPFTEMARRNWDNLVCLGSVSLRDAVSSYDVVSESVGTYSAFHNLYEAKVRVLGVSAEAVHASLVAVGDQIEIRELTSVPTGRRDNLEGLLHQASRNAHKRSRFLEKHPSLTARELLSQMKISPGSLQEMVEAGVLLRLEHSNESWFPLLQFTKSWRPLPGWPAVLAALQQRFLTDWEGAFWLTEANFYLGGKNPLDILLSDPDAVVEAIRAGADRGGF